jgi:hypothetical protein
MSVLGKRLKSFLFGEAPPLKKLDTDIGQKILLKYPETRNISKNLDLQRIFLEIEDGNFRKNADIEDHIRNNKWHDFDQYCQRHNGIDNFWITLQNLFYLYYYDDSKIDFKQMQNAMGIQQAQWSVDPFNSFKMELDQKYAGKNDKFAQGQQNFFANTNLYFNKIQFNIFDDLPPSDKQIIITKLAIYVLPDGISTKDEIFPGLKEASERYSSDIIGEQLSGSIWYKVLDTSNNRKVFFMSMNSYYGIPSSYNVNKITCFHEPIIVFGQMTPPGMVNFIIKENKRPYAGHLPNAKSNLEVFDQVTASIFMNWAHDFDHQTQLRSCNFQDNIDSIAYFGRDIIPQKNIDDITADDWLNNTKFQDKIKEYSIETFGYPPGQGKKTENAERYIDNGTLFLKYNYLPQYRGLVKKVIKPRWQDAFKSGWNGGKRKSRRKQKTRRIRRKTKSTKKKNYY